MSRVLGAEVARILAGSWRAQPGEAQTTPERLATIREPLISMGSGALAWRRIRSSAAMRECATGRTLEEYNRLLPLTHAIYSEAVSRAAAIVTEASGEPPLLIKGWAAARRYGEPHSRPMGDIDLCPVPGSFRRSAEALQRHALGKWGDARMGANSFTLDVGLPYAQAQVDLHADLEKFQLAPLETVFLRAETVELRGVPIRLLAPEEDLRLLTLHLLEHAAARPAWLSDIAALLECLPQAFDWERCMGPEPWRRSWIGAICRLAEMLLEANLSRTTSWIQRHPLPAWVVQTTLRAWGRSYSFHKTRPMFRDVLLRGYGDGLWRELAARWPNPIEASLRLRARPETRTRLPMQLAEVADRIARKLRRR